MVESGELTACREQHLLVKHIRNSFKTEDIYTDDQLLTKYLGLVKYFPYERLFEWEEFIFALHNCTFKRKDNRPRWPDLFCLIGRGAGKDGFIAFDAFALASPYNPVAEYNCDICANNEEQAMTPVKDILNALEKPGQTQKLKRHFHWNKEEITGRKNRSVIKGRTNNPKGKDGLRSGKVILNEIHQSENYDNINVFTTGLGKKPHPRRMYMTTNGDVRDGPLDDLLDTSKGILEDGEPDNGLLPFICRLDDKKEVDNPENWAKANPSLPYRPDLQEEIAKEYWEWKRKPETLSAFMTKRMNIPDANLEVAVTDYENIKATNRRLPDLDRWECVLGLDYASVRDFASIVLHFRRGAVRYDIHHSWLCMQSKDLYRIKANWREWAKMGLLTLVDETQIHPDLLAEYILDMGKRYHIKKVALDNNRFALVAESLLKAGFDGNNREQVKLVRPNDISAVAPLIESIFTDQNYVWGNDPILRWGTNNVKVLKRKQRTGVDTGNIFYAKIEAKSRKTDPFMALAAAMTIESELGDGNAPVMMPLITF